ncbi:MAG TPA: 50S ribosomal protein L11 methyltransferase, partial [Chlamydiales bacterium]|nr:50S ribosomal protein L11 methyltransferase [Chlamydiales bacterium]
THLMLQLMQGKVKGQRIVDIGCGSGILSLAALQLGAASAMGIDIDPEAIEHAQKNAELNQLDAVFGVDFSREMPADQVLLMNMILPEQKIVMQQSELLNRAAKTWITSGILIAQRNEYYALTRQWGWTLKKESQRGEWLGMVFEGCITTDQKLGF